jgi:hypothetical protein
LPFPSFPEFLIAPLPFGLGLRCIDGALLVRHALGAKRQIAAWVEVLEFTRNKSGRPKNLAIREGFAAYKKTKRDYLLLWLKQNHAELFLRVCNGELTPNKAGKMAKPPKVRARQYDVEWLKGLSVAAQTEQLQRVFRAVSSDAQYAFLKDFGDALGPNFAERWRHQCGSGN